MKITRIITYEKYVV